MKRSRFSEEQIAHALRLVEVKHRRQIAHRHAAIGNKRPVTTAPGSGSSFQRRVMKRRIEPVS